MQTISIIINSEKMVAYVLNEKLHPFICFSAKKTRLKSFFKVKTFNEAAEILKRQKNRI